ncbi:RING/U-box superfamily protein [Actinidia rufa]|uniref:RING-type E3 ubiquitin transferase n=1 Tax=Actinidia rufa TaxID=165716 RepID=A0A7J0DQ38_9ERIC|nr:RING/U-box superfamily protein [Actinidia rufa]
MVMFLQVLASNMIFLGVVVFVPFSLGRIITHYVSWLLSSATSPVLSTMMPLTESFLSLANINLKSALTAVTNLTSDGQENSLLDQVAEMLKANATEQHEVSNNISSSLSADIRKGASSGASRFSDVTTLAVGYMFIFSLVFLYLGIFALIRYTKGEPLSTRRFYGIASIAETIPSLFRQFVAAMRHLTTMIKVAFLLIIELGVFPLTCGWWLDICTIRMFGTSIAQRVEFFSVSPLASSLVHWVVGLVYMLQISIFVSLLRGVLRNGVLYFLRDPADPNYNPFRDLIDDPVHKHTRRVLLSVAVYGSLIVMLVFLPVKLAMRVAPSVFPLDISVSDPFTEIPADMLVFQICVPFAIQHFKSRTTIKSLLRYWFTGVGWALGLIDFLLPKPEDSGAQENGNGEPARADRLHAPLGRQDQALGGIVAPDDLNRGRHALMNTNLTEDFDGDEQSDSDGPCGELTGLPQCAPTCCANITLGLLGFTMLPLRATRLSSEAPRPLPSPQRKKHKTTKSTLAKTDALYIAKGEKHAVVGSKGSCHLSFLLGDCTQLRWHPLFNHLIKNVLLHECKDLLNMLHLSPAQLKISPALFPYLRVSLALSSPTRVTSCHHCAYHLLRGTTLDEERKSKIDTCGGPVVVEGGYRQSLVEVAKLRHRNTQLGTSRACANCSVAGQTVARRVPKCADCCVNVGATIGNLAMQVIICPLMCLGTSASDDSEEMLPLARVVPMSGNVLDRGSAQRPHRAYFIVIARQRYGFVLRIVLLLVLAWMTLLLVNSALIVVPISLGRALFNSIPRFPITHGIKCNDLYAFVIGSYVIWTIAAGARYSLEQIKTRRARVLLNQIWKWCAIVLKSSALLSIWILVIPDWALGLIFLKIWTRMVMLDHMVPLVDESWRSKFERVREDGFSRLQGFWVLREIVLPIIMKLLTALCVPYVLARGVFPVFGYPLVVNSAVYRFAWLGCLSFSLLCFCAKRFHVWFTNLHNSIRDDRYLIGRRLHNYGEDSGQRQSEEGNSLEIQNSDTRGTGLIQHDHEADVGLRLRRANWQEA